MALTDSLRILITANGAQAEREFAQVGASARRNLGQAETSAGQFGRSLTSAGVAMATFGGVALVGLYKAAQAAQEEDLAIAKLNNSMANSPELAGASADAFLEQAAALQDVTTFSDDATIAAQAMLGTFHLTQSEILGLTPLVQDLAGKFDLDLNRASILVGKAMDGNIGTLQRMGVRIDETSYATDRYSAVMQALRENAGGFAEQEGATFNGQMQIMKNNLGDIAEGVGRGAVEAFNSLLGPVKAVSDAFEDLSPGAQSAVGKIAVFGSMGLVAVGATSVLAGWLIKITEAYRLVVPAAEATTAANTGVAASATAAKVAMIGGAAAAVGLAAAWAHAQDNLKVEFDIADLLTGTDAQLEQAAETLQWLVDEGGDAGDALEAFAGLAETNITAATRFGAAWGAAGGPVLEINRVLSEAGRAAELAALGLDENSSSAEELAAQYSALSQEIDNYLTSIFGTEEAAVAEAEAQQALFDALVQNGHQFNLNTEAGRANISARNDWVGAVAAQIQAAGEYGSITGDTEGAQRRMNAAVQSAVGDLQAARQASLITAEQFRNLRQRILEIPSDAHTTIRADNTQALNAIAEATRRGEEFSRRSFIAHMDIQQGGGFDTPGLGARAAGGPVEAGTPYMVGERGPELFMPTGAGRIVPNHDLRGRSTRPASTESLSADEIGRAVAKHLQSKPLMTVGVG